MQAKSDGVSRVQRSFKDAETLKREELHRRRLLRIEQVRQQSKDVASLVRQKVNNEREKQLGLVQDRANAKTQQWQVRRLKQLQGEYSETVQNVGKSHADAANLPDEEAAKMAEAEKIALAAQKRGQEALNRLREEERARQKANDERRFQLLNVRAVEEARSAAVVALPCPDSTVGIKSIPPKTTVNIVPSSVKVSGPSKTSLPEWPKKLWSQQALPLGMIDNDHSNEQGDSSKTETRDKKWNQDNCVDPGSVPVSSHGDSYQPRKPLHEPETFRGAQVLASNDGVKLYDYTSCFPSQYGKATSIVEKVQSSGQINAKEAADRCTTACDVKCNPSATQREQQRGREALQRVQAQRDHKHFLSSLSSLARQNAALSSCGGPPEKPWIQSNNQGDLKLAVENILQDAEQNPCLSTSETDSVDTPDNSLLLSRLEDTPGSAPRLNVGLWRPQDTPSKQEDFPELKMSSSGSIIVAPAPPALLSVSNSRHENNERETALRSLVQRINNERHSLLLSGQHPLVTTATQDVNQDNDIKNLEEKVRQQRDLLKIQQSEVKRLGKSIAAPECVNTQRGSDEAKSSNGASSAHESVVIEPSDHSTDSSFHTPAPEIPVKRKGKKYGEDNSLAKDALFYSMDVSMSSVIMDQTETSSSGSKSLSLHGVQVLVKVCGTDEELSGSRSMSTFEENGRVKVTELSSSSDSEVHESEGKRNHHHQVDDNLRRKKVKGATICKKSKERVSKADGEIKEKMPCSSPLSPNKENKLKSEKILRKVPKDGSKKKSLKKVVKNGAEKGAKVVVEGIEKARKPKEAPKVNSPERLLEQSLEERQEQPTSTSTSYLSPPDKVLSSLTEDIKTLMALAQKNIPPQSGVTSNYGCHQVAHSEPLASYINRLLTMSRESIDRLNVSCSEVSTPSSALFKSSSTESVTEIGVSRKRPLAEPNGREVLQSITLNQHDADDTTHCQESVHNKSVKDDWLLHAASTDHGALTDMTRQCHERISALTKMIEEVRRQAAVNSSTDGDSSQSADNQSRSTLHLDSTAYMSPPPHVLQWANIAAPTQAGNDSGMSLDPYSNAVVQLLADVRSHMSSKGTDLLDSLQAPTPGQDSSYGHINHGRPKPPVAFWRTIERCNAMSPTEPHELSTIHELGTTLPESIVSHGTAPASPSRDFPSPSTPGTPPDVIAELMRRNLLTSPFAWAKKIDNAGMRSSASSSPMKNSLDSDLSSGKTGEGRSNVSASRETNSVSVQSQNSSSNGSKDWKTNILMSPVDLYSSADEVEGDFRRMGIGWVGAMLRKTKEAGALSTTSSSDGSPMKIDNANFKEVFGLPDEPILNSSVAAAMSQGRGHSTPIKHTDLSSSGSHSHLV